ncbi:MAG: hypothetical protein ABI840_06120 [bacterium]
MKLQLSFVLILISTALLGQWPKNGIYIGSKLPFASCYTTVNDSVIEVEYFFKKSGLIFDHFPPKRINVITDTKSKKQILKSEDDSLTIKIKSDYLLVKKKNVFNIKVYKSSVASFNEIENLRNQHSLYSFSHNLHTELSRLSGFNSQLYWDKLRSYELENKLNLSEAEFNEKLKETGKMIKKEFEK